MGVQFGGKGGMSSTEEKPPREVVIFGKEELSEVTLAVGHKEFKVHKMILAMMSDYFQALFFGDSKEKNQDRIELKADPVAFQRMLTFIYDRNFGDETFLECPSKLEDPNKGLGIDTYSLYNYFITYFLNRPELVNTETTYGIDIYQLHEVLVRFDVEKAIDYFWEVANKSRCPAEFQEGDWVSDCEHCLNHRLVAAIYNAKTGVTKYTGRAVKAWMGKYHPIVSMLVYSIDNAFPRIIREMIL